MTLPELHSASRHRSLGRAQAYAVLDFNLQTCRLKKPFLLISELPQVFHYSHDQQNKTAVVIKAEDIDCIPSKAMK